MKVRAERTGWRDEKLSARHREWGFDCPAMDIDFLLVEYDQRKPIALVEYKHEAAKPQRKSDVGYQVVSKLATDAGLPFFACRYSDCLTSYTVVPINEIAKGIIGQVDGMSEKEWVHFLYYLRGRHLPEKLFDSQNLLKAEL